MEEEVSKKKTKKKKGKKKIIIPPIIVFILVGLGVGVFMFLNTSAMIVANTITKSFKEAIEVVANIEDFDLEKEPVLIGGTFVLDTDIEGLEDLSKEKIGYSFGTDLKHEKMELGLSLKEDKTKIFDLGLYIANKKAYLSLKDDLAKLIELGDVNDFSELDITSIKYSKEDIILLMKEITLIFTNSIEFDKIEKSSDTIKVDGKNTKVTKITYDLNEENARIFRENIRKNALNSQDFIKILARLTGESENEIRVSLQKESGNGEIGTINIYTSGLLNKLVKAELVIDEGSLSITKGKNTNVNLKVDDAFMDLEIFEYSKEKLSIKFRLGDSEDNFDGSFTSSLKKLNETDYLGNIELKLNVAKQKFTLTTAYDVRVGSSISSIDSKKIITQEELQSSEEFAKAYIEVLSRLSESNLMNILELFGVDITSFILGM